MFWVQTMDHLTKRCSLLNLLVLEMGNLDSGQTEAQKRQGLAAKVCKNHHNLSNFVTSVGRPRNAEVD